MTEESKDTMPMCSDDESGTDNDVGSSTGKDADEKDARRRAQFSKRIAKQQQFVQDRLTEYKSFRTATEKRKFLETHFANIVGDVCQTYTVLFNIANGKRGAVIAEFDSLEELLRRNSKFAFCSVGEMPSRLEGYVELEQILQEAKRTDGTNRLLVVVLVLDYAFHLMVPKEACVRAIAALSHMKPTCVAVIPKTETQADEIIQRSKLGRACSLTTCKQAETVRVFQKCSKCKTVVYCSTACQTAHWPDHKLTCVSWKTGL